MKQISCIYKAYLIIPCIITFFVLSCKENLPSGIDSSDKFTVLESIKIVNAGKNGDIVLEGTINEKSKTVSFPRIDPETDFGNLKFEAIASDGAKLEKDSYEVAFEEGNTQRTITIKVTNAPRFREYYVNLRLKVPVFGADFSKAIVHNFAGYSAFSGQMTRGSGFDGKYVLVVQRTAIVPSTPHLLRVSDLMNGVTNNRINLNMTGVSDGFYDVNCGAQVNGHTYIATLSISKTSPIKVYHWSDPTQAPETIVNVIGDNIPGSGVRHGDNLSVSLDKNGNGFIHLISNDNPSKILGFQVTNYNQVGAPFVINSSVNYGQWSAINRVGTTDNFLLTAYQKAISVVNGQGTPAYTMSTTSIPFEGTDARVFTFNEKRYMIMATVPRTGSETGRLYAYDITLGDNIVEALTAFENGSRTAAYEYVFAGVTNSAPSTQTGWHIEKDQEGKDKTLFLFCASTDIGFAIIEVPIAIAED